MWQQGHAGRDLTYAPGRTTTQHPHEYSAPRQYHQDYYDEQRYGGYSHREYGYGRPQGYHGRDERPHAGYYDSREEGYEARRASRDYDDDHEYYHRGAGRSGLQRESQAIHSPAPSGYDPYDHGYGYDHHRQGYSGQHQKQYAPYPSTYQPQHPWLQYNVYDNAQYKLTQQAPRIHLPNGRTLTVNAAQAYDYDRDVAPYDDMRQREQSVAAVELESRNGIDEFGRNTELRNYSRAAPAYGYDREVAAYNEMRGREQSVPEAQLDGMNGTDEFGRNVELRADSRGGDPATLTRYAPPNAYYNDTSQWNSNTHADDYSYYHDQHEYSREQPRRSTRLAAMVRQPHPRAAQQGNTYTQANRQYETDLPMREHDRYQPPPTPKAQSDKKKWAATTDTASRSPSRPKSPHKDLLPRPVPTPAYLREAYTNPETASSPRPLLIVLDLNGTLLYRKNRSASFIGRRRLAPFLHDLLANYSVMIWSSARPENVKRMCEQILSPEQRKQLVAIWGRDKLHLTPAQYTEKVQVYKQLSWVWADKDIQASAAAAPWDQNNTVLIDDSVEKAASEPHNLLEIDEFEARPAQMEEDVLGQVVRYLEELRVQKDVSAYMRVKPFVFDRTATPYERLSDVVVPWRLG